MLAKKTPPEYGESLGPMIVACARQVWAVSHRKLWQQLVGYVTHTGHRHAVRLC